MKSRNIDGGMFCSGESLKKRGSKIQSIMRGSHIKQQVIAYEKYGHGKKERSSVAIISAANVVGGFAWHIIQVFVMFRGLQAVEQKQLALVRYMDGVDPLDSTRDLLECVVLYWGTDNDVIYTNIQVVLNLKEPPAPWNGIVDL